MSAYDTNGIESTELEPRTERALTECMTVLPEGGDIHTVVGENGTTYVVDSRVGRCTCPDAEYREPSGGCKHQRRVEFATGARPVPAGVDGVDGLLGEHTDETPRVVATDGGIVEAGDEGEILEDSETDDDSRPADCDCGEWNDGLTLACWPCYREGFESPNPNPDDDTDQ